MKKLVKNLAKDFPERLKLFFDKITDFILNLFIMDHNSVIKKCSSSNSCPRYSLPDLDPNFLDVFICLWCYAMDLFFRLWLFEIGPKGEKRSRNIN